MTLFTSGIKMVGSPNDSMVVTDPAVRFRPDRIIGRRYLITTSAPKTGTGTGNDASPASESTR